MEGCLWSFQDQSCQTKVTLLNRIDILEVKDRILLYVVNHSQSLTKESIEKFEVQVDTNELIWLKTITHKEIYSINDLTLLSEDEFYATNDHYFSFRFKVLRAIETRVGHGKGKKWQRQEKFAFACLCLFAGKESNEISILGQALPLPANKFSVSRQSLPLPAKKSKNGQTFRQKKSNFGAKKSNYFRCFESEVGKPNFRLF